MTIRLVVLFTIFLLSVGLVVAHGGDKGKKSTTSTTKTSCCITSGSQASAELPAGHPKIETASTTRSKTTVTKVSTTDKTKAECTAAEMANCDENADGKTSVKKASLKMDCCKDSKATEVKADNADTKKESTSNPDGGTH